MKPLSATKASKLAKKTKQTILDAIDEGTLSAEKNTRGHWQIDPAELNRVFPFELEDQKGDQSPIPMKTGEKTNETSLLELELKHAREKLADKEAQIEDLKAQRDKWEGQATQLAIANQNTPSQHEIKRRSVLARIFGG